MKTFYYDMNTYSALANLAEAHPTARAEHIRVRGPDTKLRYLNGEEETELHRLVKALPRRTDDDRDQAPAQLRVRLYNDEYGACVGAAKAEGVNVRAWATRVLLAAAKAAEARASVGVGTAEVKPCLSCGGSGTVDGRCRTCGGSGTIEVR